MTSMGANCSKTKTRETIIAAPSWKPKNNVCLLSHTNVTCDAAKGGLVRFCYCAAAPANGQIQGDPHIHSLLGEHYTLMKRGNFLAWSFSKTSSSKKTPVEWQLFASYSGSRFTTQGLLLLEKHSARAMEMTAEDCTWRTKSASGWRDVKTELLSGEVASFDVKDAQSNTKDGGI